MLCLGVSGTLLREVLPADNGSALLVSWLWLREETGGELLHFVLEWAGVAVAVPQWKRLATEQNNTSITGTDHWPSCQLCQPVGAIINSFLFYFIPGSHSNAAPR